MQCANTMETRVTTEISSSEDSETTEDAGRSRSGLKRRPDVSKLLLVPAIAVILCFFLYPILTIVWDSFTDPKVGLQNYAKLLNDNVTVKVLGRTLVTTVFVTVGTLILAYPYAYAMTLVSGGTRRLMMLVVLVPFWTSLMARTFSWYVIEQRGGVIAEFFSFFGLDVVLLGSITGVAVAMIQVMLPFMVLPLYSGLSGIDLRLIDAAKTLGANRFRSFKDVYFRLSVPAIASGASLVFIITLGFYVTPALLGSPREAMLSQIIAMRVNDLLDFAGAGALGLLLFVLTLAVVILLSRMGNLTSVAGAKADTNDT